MTTYINHNPPASDLPHGWAWTTIGEISQRVTKGSTPTSYGFSYQADGIRFVKAENITESGNIGGRCDYIDQETNEFLRRSILEANDILFSIAGTIGRVGIVQEKDLPANTNQALAIIIGLWRNIDSTYLFHYLKSPDIQKRALGAMVGVGRANLSLTNLSEFAVPLAPLPEQHRIVAKIEELFTRLDAGVAALKRMQANLKRYKAAVLKAACEGRLVPQDPNDEPASKLLEQIREKRRQKYIADEIAALKLVLQSRISSSDVHYTPEEVIRDWLIEVVLDTIDRSPQTALPDLKYPLVVNTIISRFFERVHEVIEHRVRQRNYLQWLDDSLRLLIAESAPSEVLLKQAQAWARYIQEEMTPGRPRDTISMEFGASDSKFLAVRRGMEARSIRESGVDYIRREYIEKPAVDKWLKDEARRRSPNVANLPELPRGWCWTSVEQVGMVQLGRQRAPQHHQGSNMRPYLRVANVFEDRIDTSDVMRMNFTPAEYETYRLEYGDILLNEGQSPELLGRPAMYRDEVPGACFQNTLIRFRATGAVHRNYALTVFLHYLHSGRFAKESTITTNIAHLSAGRFSRIEFPLPPLAEQRRIAAEVERRLSVVQEMEAALVANLARAERLRQSILKRAFEGKLVPQDPSDEPAGMLLERIKAERVGATLAVARRAGTRRKGARRAGASPAPTEMGNVVGATLAVAQNAVAPDAVPRTSKRRKRKT